MVEINFMAVSSVKFHKVFRDCGFASSHSAGH